jgi:hypothetical protein
MLRWVAGAHGGQGVARAASSAPICRSTGKGPSLVALDQGGSATGLKARRAILVSTRGTVGAAAQEGMSAV